MASINDVDVTEYIERLRQLSGLEIDTAKSGTQMDENHTSQVQ